MAQFPRLLVNCSGEDAGFLRVKSGVRGLAALCAHCVVPACREMDITNVGETVHIKGIDLYRYILAPSMLYNTSITPSNAEYFGWGPSGLLNVSNCNLRIPVRPPPTHTHANPSSQSMRFFVVCCVPSLQLFVSKPHFLDASTNVLAAVNITPPSRELHDTYVDVEPVSESCRAVVNRACVRG